MRAKSPISPEILFVISLVALMAVSGWVLRLEREEEWSKQMGIRTSLGFKSHLSSPLIACQLSEDPADLATVFGRDLDTRDPTKSHLLDLKPIEKKDDHGRVKTKEDPLVPASKNDAKVIRRLLQADFAFIGCYFFLMWSFAKILQNRHGLPTKRLARLVFVVLILTVVADCLENYYSLRSVEAMVEGGELDAKAITMMRAMSLAKWWLFAPMILILAWGAVRLKGLWASVAGLVLAAGGVTLLWGLLTIHWHAVLIEVGFAIVCLGAPLSLGAVLDRSRKVRV